MKFSNWSAPNVFACQMKLVCDWFRLWDAEERNMFQGLVSWANNCLRFRHNASLSGTQNPAYDPNATTVV